MRFSTRAIHAGQDADPTTGATIVPIYQTSTYTQTGIGEHRGFDYSRTVNPTRVALERQLASLDEARFCSAFASGMAATTAVMNILSSGDHVVVGDDLYGGSYRLFSKIFERYGVTFTYVDATDLGAVAAAVRPNTKMLWIETPSNPLLKLTDIAAVALLKPAGALLVVDNTFATAYLQSPLALGADIAVYSTTKYVAGHSDVLGGAAVSNDQAVADTIKFNQNASGGVPGPLDCFLVSRGAKTLARSGCRRTTPTRARSRSSSPRATTSNASTIRDCQRTPTTNWPSDRCAASAGWSRSFPPATRRGCATSPSA